jgi:hypothetical protein
MLYGAGAGNASPAQGSIDHSLYDRDIANTSAANIGRAWRDAKRHVDCGLNIGHANGPVRHCEITCIAL